MSYPTVSIATTVVDPFYLYLDLTSCLGEGEVYLLDAAQESGNELCGMSILGAKPVLEIQVKDDRIYLFAIPGLAEYLARALGHAGCLFSRVEESVANASAGFAPSVVAQSAFEVTGTSPMVFLENVRTLVRSLFPDNDMRPFSAGFLGYIGYDGVHYLERLPKTTTDDRDLPDIRLQWHACIIQLHGEEVQMYSHVRALGGILAQSELMRLNAALKTVETVVGERRMSPDERPLALGRLVHAANVPAGEVEESVTQDEYEQAVARAKEYIQAGDIFQVVLSKRMRLSKALHHHVVYEQLRKLNPSPYMFMSEYPDMRLFGASPEVQFRSVARQAEMKPIAGTSKGRGATPEEDRRLAERLLADEKERAEHVMLVDLCRNDLGRVCETGSVHVPEFMVVEPYSHLFHLVSSVKGVLKENVSVFHALLATFPAGTLSGAPKIRAMEIIDELERFRRGPYGGLVGMIDFDANANTAIVIRSVVEHGGYYYVQVGAGIVADSDGEQEWNECGHKAGAMIDVLLGRR